MTNLNQMPRPERQLYSQCAHPGCNRQPRSYSRFCTLHARNFHRTRDPNGRAVRLGEIKVYMQLAEEFLSRNAAHPAVVAAEAFLQATLGDTTQPSAIRRELTRLRVDGATPRAMLVTFLGMWGLGHFRPFSVTTDACRDFNLGNRVLRTTKLPSVTSRNGKRQPLRLPARVAEAFGSHLRARLGVFASQFWTHVQGELDAPERAANAVAAAVRETPFGVVA
jgi:hypothetical protein